MPCSPHPSHPPPAHQECFSFSCSIEEEGGAALYIIGDGSYSPTVIRYSVQGDSTGLPDLMRGRGGPGCSGYNNKNNQFVLLVAGGFTGEGEYIASTERFTVGLSASWEEAAALPHPLSDPRAVTLHNNIFLFGKTTTTKSRSFNQYFRLKTLSLNLRRP